MTPAPHPVTVVGAGFSGTMTALQILARHPDARVRLFDRAATFGQGLAYGTDRPEHLLNVRAANMSAFPDRPDHFERWLEAEERPGLADTPAGRFAPRGLYGRYLDALLAEAGAGPDSDRRLCLVHDAVVGLRPDGGGFLIERGDGGVERASAVVLALGNLRGGDGEAPFDDPWAPGAFADLDPARPVLILGTGLTMVDVAAALDGQGFRGPIRALSRRGLLPQAHDVARPWPAPAFTDGERGSAARLLRRVRADAHAAGGDGGGWRGVIDGLRPATVDLWRGLPLAEKRRFLRHLRPWWDVHRHRMAPPVAERIGRLQSDGQLTVTAGRLVATSRGADGIAVEIRRRGGALERLHVQRVYDARGFDELARVGDPLVRALLEQGLCRLDPLGLGLETTADLKAVNRAGTPEPGLYALGPIVRGVFWECTAVPDIRNQAGRVAAALVEA